MNLSCKQNFWKGILFTVVGTGIYSMGVHFFTAPNKIAPGGIAGIATAINYLTNFPIGWFNTFVNIPLLILGYFYLGRLFILKTISAVISFTLFQDYLLIGLPQYQGDPLIAALFGGALLGVGTGIAFVGESSTGGMDIANKVIQKKFPYLKLGSVTLITNLIVILFAAYVYHDISTSLYAVVAIFVMSKALDAVLYGLDVGKMVFIITAHGDEIAKELIQHSSRGITKFKTVGAYTEHGNTTLLCAVRQNEYYQLKHRVNRIDPNAFMIVATASEVVGKGFKSPNE